ncbi:S8 family serine peptidase [Nocardioides sp.]|uniref:S8 family serine peptidase n=1 Tax=Nocardioides sp. TaxID=35761 RepID=UPI0039E369A8
MTLSSASATTGSAGLKPASATALTGSDSGTEKDGTVIALGDGPGPETYIVQLDDPAVPTRALATSRTTAKVPSAKRYRSQILDDQAAIKSDIRGITGSPLEVEYTYTNAINGFAVSLTRAQAAQVAKLPGISAVQIEIKRELQTDVGPEWIGAPGIWDGDDVPDGVGSKGEGVVVGIIDTGINAANPSFAATVPVSEGGDGYTVTNPRDHYYGVCDPDNTDGDQSTGGAYIPDWGCNDKLIGYYNFLSSDTDGGTDYDYDGHGSHTASTAAGNQVSATTYAAEGTANEFSTTETIKGVAPHANIIAYAACCEGAALIAAIDQAIADEVDVINYSIGSSAPATDPWDELVAPDAVGFLNARAAGIDVAVSAGNDGPDDTTVGSPANAPWVTSAAATTHNRQWQAEVQDISADDGSTLDDIDGVAFAAATDGTYPLIDAADAGDELCEDGELDTDAVAGKIVVCLRGTNGRLEKGQAVLDAGGAGMILVNDEASGDSLNADAHVLPAVHLTYDDGVALRAWLADHKDDNPEASLSGGVKYVGDDVADIMAAFSSRGPNGAMSIISPSVAAPGVDILAAAGTDNDIDYEFESGTSMASPHTAGSLALLHAVHDDWSPAERQSALMTTASEDVKNDDGVSPAGWFDMGSGRVDLTKAAEAGFVLDENEEDYLAANPQEGGDVRTLNLASMADDECLVSCSWTRTLTGTSTGVGTWTVTTESDSGDLQLSVAEDSIDLSEGGTADLVVTAQVDSAASTEDWLFGKVTLTPPAGSTAPVAHLPVAVLPSDAVLPDSIDITTSQDSGSQSTDGFRTVATDDLQVSSSGLVLGQTDQLSLVQDPTYDDPFDGLRPQDGVRIKRLTVPANATRVVASLANATATDLDLYVGRGAVDPDNLVCYSASGGSKESCDFVPPYGGSYWVLVQDWEAGDGATDTVDLTTAVVSGSPGNLTVTGPESVEAGVSFPLTTAFDEPDMEPGQTWFGTVTLGTGISSPDDLGQVPVNLTRVADEVGDEVGDATVGLALTPASVAANGSSEATATVTSSTGVVPTGQVQFLVDGAVRATGTLDAAGKATTTLSGLAIGTHSVVASYLGDSLTKAGTSAAVSLVVADKVAPALTVKAKKKVKVGVRPKVTVTVFATGVTPTGTVTIKAKQGKRTKVYTVQLVNGVATVRLRKATKPGRIKLTVTYSGDAAVAPATAKKGITVKRKR